MLLNVVSINIVLIFFAAPTNCIVGGQNVTNEDQNYFKHCVYITNSQGVLPRLHASGFIFDSKTIITAAHNVAGEPGSSLYVRVGSRFYDSGGVIKGVIADVSEVIVHPEYKIHSYEFDNDIAILKLKKELIFDDWTARWSNIFQVWRDNKFNRFRKVWMGKWCV